MGYRYTEKSTIGRVLQNPFGRDLLTTLSTMGGVPMKLIDNPATRSITLYGLTKLSGGKIDAGFVDFLCQKLNAYAQIPPVKHPGQIKPKWWKEAVFYQIYPRSFADSNGDGIGDLRGILSKLDYLKGLGVDGVWLSPIYQSPNDDNGYDISDYQKIMSDFGTMTDFNALLKGIKERGMRLIMDLVINHTSDEHRWFKKASASADSEYRDYYIWRDPKNGAEPNNWNSMFSGPAWKYSEKTGQYYLHTFSEKQVDLNWKNQAVREELYKMINWWLDKGVDGFRLDVINMIDKPDGLPDSSELLAQSGHGGMEHYFFGECAHEYLHEMHQNTLKGRDCFTVGETPGIGIELARLFTAAGREELSTVFSFEHLYSPGTSRTGKTGYDLNFLKSNMIHWQTNYGNDCWPSLFTDNHDNPRMVARIDSREQVRLPLAKMLATILFTLKGTPFIYQGQEIGMTMCPFADHTDYRDVETLNYMRENPESLPEDELKKRLFTMTRDHARTPMQWNSGCNGGFTEGEPWIMVNPNCSFINAEDDMANPDSILNYYKSLIALRKQEKALVYGEFIEAMGTPKGLFCYYRVLGKTKFIVEINLSAKSAKRSLELSCANHIMGNYGMPTLLLRPYEANIYKLED